MNKTTLSTIIAGTMNWGVWDKNLYAKRNGKYDPSVSKLRLPLLTTLIFMAFTTRADFGKTCKCTA
jgi:hypothetical protein